VEDIQKGFTVQAVKPLIYWLCSAPQTADFYQINSARLNYVC